MVFLLSGILVLCNNHLFFLVDYMKSGDATSALQIIYDFLESPRARTWNQSLEDAMELFLHICLAKRDSESAKDGINQYRNLCPNNVYQSLGIALFANTRTLLPSIRSSSVSSTIPSTRSTRLTRTSMPVVRPLSDPRTPLYLENHEFVVIIIESRVHPSHNGHHRDLQAESDDGAHPSPHQVLFRLCQEHFGSFEEQQARMLLPLLEMC